MKIGYYIRNNVRPGHVHNVYLGGGLEEAKAMFSIKFPEKWALDDWWIERCLHVDAFGEPTWTNIDLTAYFG